MIGNSFPATVMRITSFVHEPAGTAAAGRKRGDEQVSWELVVIIVLILLNVVLSALLLLRRPGSGTGVSDSTLRGQFREHREETAVEARSLRDELGVISKRNTDALTDTMRKLGDAQGNRLQELKTEIKTLSEGNERRLERLTDKVAENLGTLQKSNEEKLERMRQTVDEKLQGTLEKRLGESFKLVSERLEAVHKGLGEMQKLATGVGDLKAVLSNVKTRGSWGEIQLGALLEQILAPVQYCTNAKPNPDTDAVVEFAIRLPGADDGSSEVLLPIDAKFPMEDYNRLLDAAEKGDSQSIQLASNSLLRAVERSARDIREKYVNPPHTTDFAIMYLPTEGLYAEVVRTPELLDSLQRRHRIVVAGPTTLAAILNSLQMGFRTLAIEKRSSEVWKVLSAVKSEFGKFGDVLDKVKRQIGTVSKSLEDTDVRRRVMDRTLRDVEQLPEPSKSSPLIGPDQEGSASDEQ